MKKMRHFEIWNENYQIKMVFVVGGDKDSLVKLVKRKYKLDIYKYYSREFKLGAAAHFDFENENPYKLIWLERFTMSPLWIGSLVHEITHHVSELCDKRDISKESKYDEPVAYLNEFYTREILKKLKKLK